jgi:hypothetical protein
MLAPVRRTRKGEPRVCILHIGLEKTGTTSIQTWLYNNESALLAQGLGLTRSFSRPNNWDFVNFFQVRLDDWATLKAILNEEHKQRYFADFDKRFDEEIGNLGSTNILLTSEHFSSRLRTSKELVKLRDFLALRFDQIRILAWFRPQWDVAVSSWSTSIKTGHYASLGDWLGRIVPDNYYFNYERIAENWSNVFGKDNCIFNVYQPEGSPGGNIVEEFLAALELCGCRIDSKNLDFNGERENTSMSLAESAVVRAINAKVPFWIDRNGIKTRNKFNSKFRASLPELKSNLPISISMAEKLRIHEAFKSSNERFFNTFLGGRGFSQPDSKTELPVALIEDLSTDLFSLVAHFLDFSSTELRPSLLDPDADLLRDSAEVLETLGYKEEALGLLKLAHRVRPQGPLINKRMREIERQIRK